jgi:predicted MFS family arabinose efflux permease
MSYHWKEKSVFALTGVVVLVISLILLATLKYLPSRFSMSIHIENKKSAAFCAPILFPGVIFLFGVGAWASFEQFAPIYGKDVGVNNVAAIFFLIGIAVIALRLGTSYIVDNFPVRISMSIALVAGICATVTMVVLNSSLGMYLGAILLAISLGFFYPSFALAGLRRGHEYETGTVLGTLSMLFDIGFGVMPALLGYWSSEHGFRSMFAICAGFSFIALALAQFMRVPSPVPSDAEPIGAPDALI